MEDIFHDISKYYAANIVGNVLTIGRIFYQDGGYHFARDDVQGPFNLIDPDADDDVTRMVHVIAEIHPLSVIEKIIDVDVVSCLYLNENDDSGEIEVRSIHKGMGTAIYSKQQCPLIFWNPKYEEHMYFDVMDIQNVFREERLKNSFSTILAESLRAYELFPPLVHLKK
ncbi:MAG: hypothetical protein QNJ85_15185 [Gammaproteobacteria bacterium]|nr:hypothetical protein [Gammaproteobacteria bacterium]